MWSTLPHFDAVADLHPVTHQHDLGRGSVTLRGEHCDFTEDLALRDSDVGIAEHGEELARLNLIVAAKVDLHELPFAERLEPFAPLRVDNQAVRLPARRTPKCRERRTSRQRNPNLRR